MPDDANVLVNVGCYFRCDKPCTCNYTCTQRFLLLRSCAYLNFLGKFGFRAYIGLHNQMSDSSRVRASKRGPFTTLCGYVCRGQQGKIEKIHPPPTNSKIEWNHFVLQAILDFGAPSRCNLFVHLSEKRENISFLSPPQISIIVMPTLVLRLP